MRSQVSYVQAEAFLRNVCRKKNPSPRDVKQLVSMIRYFQSVNVLTSNFLTRDAYAHSLSEVRDS